MTYVLTTGNPGKAREIAALLEAAGLAAASLKELGLSFAPRETGATFEENALQKAAETAEFLRGAGHSSVAVLADDSGLAIDALGGRPGVDSALFMGASTPYELRNARILEMMAHAPQRTARFICVIACVLPGGQALTARGELTGEIARQPRGSGGFGYDPIFYIPSLGKTSAELSREEKNEISHRGRALRGMLDILKKQDAGEKLF